MPEKIVLFQRGDVAGKNITAALRKRHIESNILGVDDVLYTRYVEIQPDVCFIASRHKSKSGIPVLTTHSPGNFGVADFGGNSCELSIAPALFLRKALMLLKEEKERRGLQYEVSYEATHHGPTSLGFPVLFVEVGSGEMQWRDTDACDAVAEVLQGLLESEPEEVPAAIAFGGGHYCRKFSRIEEYAIGHICPRHGLDKLDRGMIEQMREKTVPEPSIALFEKKGMGKEKQRVLGLLEESGLDVVRI